MGELLPLLIIIYLFTNMLVLVLFVVHILDDVNEKLDITVKHLLMGIIFFPVTLMLLAVVLLVFIVEGITNLYNSKKMTKFRKMMDKKLF